MKLLLPSGVVISLSAEKYIPDEDGNLHLANAADIPLGLVAAGEWVIVAEDALQIGEVKDVSDLH